MSRLSLIDSHIHMQFAAYDQDREAVIARALEAGIGMVNVGTQFSTSRAAVALAARYVGNPVWATAGFHPSHCSASGFHDAKELREPQEETFEYEKFLELARNPKVVAVGECGLDY